jgi:hypothetical protein
MGKINVKDKGRAGELEACRWLRDVLNLDFLPKRTLDQTREGGADIRDIQPLLIEVKRQEILKKHDWWIQVASKCKYDLNIVPVVMYRQNHKPWKFLISANHIGVSTGYIDLTGAIFEKWARDLIKRISLINVSTYMIQ